jgi:hypothetical protein
MRIVVLGNCQAHGVAHGLAYLLPEAMVEVAQVDTAPRSPRAKAAAALIEGSDLVFAQVFAPPWGPLSYEALSAGPARLVRLPRIIFSGYQPDAVYLKHAGRPLASPLGEYHSAIIAAAFSLQVEEADVPTLFNRLVYARLGYLDAFGKARTLLQERTLGPFGAPFADAFESWHARGPFMHTANHPRGFVLADIARAAAIGAGLLPADAPRVTPAFDHLASNTVWPVYPGIAEALGVPGSVVFKRAAPPGHVGEALHMNLPALVRACYARYPTLPEAAFHGEAVGAARSVLAGIVGRGAG